MREPCSAAPIKHYWQRAALAGSLRAKGFANKGGKSRILSAIYLRSEPWRAGDLAAIATAQVRHPWARQTGASIIRPPAKNP